MSQISHPISIRGLILQILWVGLVCLTGCSAEKPAKALDKLALSMTSDFPLELQTIPLSEELAAYLVVSVEAFLQETANDPKFTDLAVRDQLVLGITRPETRKASGEELYQRWRNDPTEFLWATTAIRYDFLLNRRSERDEILASAVLRDTLSAAGAFAHGLVNYSYTSRGHFFRRASEIDGLSPLNRLLLLRKTAMVESRQGKHFVAVRQLLQALSEVRAVGGPSLEIRYWSSIALYLKRADRLDDAVHATAMGLYLADQTGNTFYQGLLRKNLAGLLQVRQEDSASLAQYQTTIEFARRENLPWVILDALDKAAGLSSSLGRPGDALVFDRQTLAHSLAMADSLNAPRNMMNIADDFLQMGVLDSCLVYQQRARVWVDHFPNKQNLAQLPFIQAEYYCHMGRYDTVDSLLTLATNQTSAVGLAMDEANLLVELIKSGLEMSKPDLAYRSLSRLQELRPLIFVQQPDQNVLADLELASADLNMVLGEYQPAGLALEKARQAIAQGGVVEKQWHYHRSAGKLAALRGDLPTAGERFGQCFELAQQSNNPGRLAESRHLLGNILLREGKTEEARSLFVDLDQDPAFGGSFRTRLTNLWFQGRCWRQAGNLNTARDVLEKAVALATPFSPSDVMAGIHLDLGRTLMEQNVNAVALHNFKKTAHYLNNSSSNTLATYLDDTRRHLAEALIAWHLRQAGNQQQSSEVNHVLNALQEANSYILRSSMGIDSVAASQNEFLDLAAGDGCTALFFLGQEHSYLWIGHNGNWDIEVLPAQNDIKKMVRPVLADLQQPTRTPDASALAALGNLLLGSLFTSWPEGSELTLVADGLLNNIPWSALILPGPEGYRVLDHGPLAESPGLMAADKLKRKPASGEFALLAMGYNGSLNQNDRLRNAENEARIIAKNWDAGPVQLLVGQDASWSAEMMAKLADISVLHLASHARVREGWASESFLLLAGDSGESPLTADSIRQLSWPGELVFLSSCEAGRSHQSGLGVMGLAGAFLTTGVKAVLASSGDVDDEAGLFLAERFYHHWSVEKNWAAALQAAQLDMVAQEQWSHPFYWSHYRLVLRPSR